MTGATGGVGMGLTMPGGSGMMIVFGLAARLVPASSRAATRDRTKDFMLEGLQVVKETENGSDSLVLLYFEQAVEFRNKSGKQGFVNQAR